ncbi:beta strand repeat-containing protein [Nicoliella lavandulae]|uniref:DUF5776 domain-containing protein n=1 Tax=Nicoliella lavandulae TaxID=3082954 RepID=A0ABU8SM43_9LACO
MLYNKYKYNKLNDKKILKKVKKQWIVVSVSMLTALGGATILSQHIAHADTTENANHTSDDTSSTTIQSSSNIVTSAANVSNSAAYTSATSTAPSASATESVESTTTSSSVTTTQDSSASQTTSSSSTDNSSQNSSSNNDATTTSSNASDSGSSSASADSKTSDSNDSGNSKASDSNTGSESASNSTTSSASASNSNRDQTSATNSSDAKSNTNTNSTQSSTVSSASSETASSSTNSGNSSASDSKSTTNSSSSSSTSGSSSSSNEQVLTTDVQSLGSTSIAYRDGVLLAATNTQSSGSSSATYDQVMASLAAIRSNASLIANSASSFSAFFNSVASAMSYANSNSAYIDSYYAMSSSASAMSSAYSQYTSISSAASSQNNYVNKTANSITSSNFNSYVFDISLMAIANDSYASQASNNFTVASSAVTSINSEYSATSSYYALADSAGANAANTTNTTVNVTTAQQFNAAVLNPYVYQINVLNNMSLKDAGYSDTDVTKTVTKNTPGKDFVINGLQKDGSTWSTINYVGVGYDVQNVNTYRAQNQNVYGTSGFGFISDNGSTTLASIPIYLNNINYTGGQAIYANNSSVFIDNKVTISSVNNYTAQNIPGDTGQHAGVSSADQNQRNMQVNSLTVNDGATYTGNTYNGNVIELNGSFTVAKTATVNLNPNGQSNHTDFSSNPNNGNGLQSTAAQALSSKGNVYVYGNINISNGTSRQGSYGTTALNISAGANVYVDGGKINVNIQGMPSAYPVYIAGNLTVQNNGQLNVIGQNVGGYGNILSYVRGSLTSQTGGLIHLSLNGITGNGQPYLLQVGSGSSVNIINQGNIQIDSDGNYLDSRVNPVLLYVQDSTAKVNINNPGNTVVFDMDTTQSDPSKKSTAGDITNADITAYSVGINNMGNTQGSYYKIVVPNSKSGSAITYYNAQTGTMNNLQGSYTTLSGSKYLSFTPSPSFDFQSPLSVRAISTGGYQVSGTLSLKNYSQSVINGNKYLYVDVKVNNNRLPSLQSNGQAYVDSTSADSNGDNQSYIDRIDVSQISSDGTVPFSYFIPASYLNSNGRFDTISVIAHYYVSTVESRLDNPQTSNNSTTNVNSSTYIDNPTTNQMLANSQSLIYQDIKTQANNNPIQIVDTASVNSATAAQSSASDISSQLSSVATAINANVASASSSAAALNTAYQSASSAYSLAQSQASVASSLNSSASSSMSASVSQLSSAFAAATIQSSSAAVSLSVAISTQGSFNSLATAISGNVYLANSHASRVLANDNAEAKLADFSSAQSDASNAVAYANLASSGLATALTYNTTIASASASIATESNAIASAVTSDSFTSSVKQVANAYQSTTSSNYNS